MVQNLVRQIFEQRPENTTVRVYDDGSRHLPKLDPRAELKTSYNHGKKLYWKKWNQIISHLPEADLYLFLPDDLILIDGFFNTVLAEWEKTPKGTTALNLLNDKGRTGRPNWVKNYATIEHGLLNTGWWDLCGIISNRGIQALKNDPIYVHPRRWRTQPHLGSGVGMAISDKLRRIGPMFQTRMKLMEHIGHNSMMNQQRRKSNPLDTWELEPIIVGMATIPGRERQCEKAIKSLLPYVDQIHLTVNGKSKHKYKIDSEKVSIFHADNSRGDAEKFSFSIVDWLSGKEIDFYYFTVDDDIIYPPGYVWTLIHAIEKYNRSAVVGVHAKTLPAKVESFYGGHTVQHHTKSALRRDQVVNCLGTGCMAFHSSTIDFGVKDCETANMADIWMAIACQRQNVPQISIARPANWLKVQELPKGSTIYEQHHKRGEVQTQIWNGAGELYGWELKTEYLQR
jgi:hypothetical protein